MAMDVDLPAAGVAGDIDGIMKLIGKLDRFTMGYDVVEVLIALHLAVTTNHSKVVELIVEADPTHEHSQDVHSETLLYLGAFGLIFGVRRNPSVDGPEGKTALHAAVISRDGYCVASIVKEREDIHDRADNKGWTVFHYEASPDFQSAHHSLIVLGDLDPTILGTMEKTALHIACYGVHSHVWGLIHFYPYLYEAVDEDGRNILHTAPEQSHKVLGLVTLLNAREKMQNLK